MERIEKWLHAVFFFNILEESLQRLVLTGLTMSSLEEPIRYRFSSLQGLRSLSLANVDFYDSGLVDLCSLPRLESLDLSNTSVTNLSPLLGLKERLRSLTLHQMKRLEMSTAQLLGVIGQLDVLQVSGRMKLSLAVCGYICWQTSFEDTFTGHTCMCFFSVVVCKTHSTWTSVMISSLPPMWLVSCLDSQGFYLLLFHWMFQGENRCVCVCICLFKNKKLLKSMYACNAFQYQVSKLDMEQWTDRCSCVTVHKH